MEARYTITKEGIIRSGQKFTNATVSDTGVVRVNSQLNNQLKQ